MDERMIGGRYRVEGTLGHGGMASVFRAVDETLGREVAVKVFRMGAVDHGERARAEAEIQVLAQLRNPALVTLYDAAIDDDGGESWLVMELVPGSDLATRLREGVIDPTTTARLGAQVADGLAAVHAAGIVHRDVKPANVLLESDGEHVKLADFGIALLRDAARVTGTGSVMGTAAYLAPEQVLGHDIGGKADVYALGLMLLECLTGRQSFPGSAVESATARLTRRPEIDQRLPTAWRTLLHVMTATEPAERPTAAEAADRLRALGRGEVAEPTRLLPSLPGGSVPAAAAADATQVLPTATGDDDATRLLTQQNTRPAASAVPPPGPVAPTPRTDPDRDRPRRRGPLLAAIIVGVLVLAGIVVAVLALGGGSNAPAPTDTGTPSQQQDQPSSAPSGPADQPSEPAEQPSQEAPSEEPSQPTEPSQPAEPSEQVPSQGPDPGVQPTLPVQTPN